MMLIHLPPAHHSHPDDILLPADPRTRHHHSFKFKHIQSHTTQYKHSFLLEQYLSGTLFLKPASTRIPSPHSRRSSIERTERCRFLRLENTPGKRRQRIDSAVISTSPENLSVSALISGDYTVVVLAVMTIIEATLKIMMD